MRRDGVLTDYDPGSLFCEMLRPGEAPHHALSLLRERLRNLPVEALRRRAADAERDLLARGITFTVYSDATAIDRILPFDLIPRVITAEEWRTLETGVIQRVRAHELPAIQSVPAIAVTAYAAGADRVRALTAGFQRHLTKPIDPRQLIEAIREVSR